MFSCEFCKILLNSCSIKNLWAAASVFSSTCISSVTPTHGCQRVAVTVSILKVFQKGTKVFEQDKEKGVQLWVVQIKRYKAGIKP